MGGRGEVRRRVVHWDVAIHDGMYNVKVSMLQQSYSKRAPLAVGSRNGRFVENVQSLLADVHAN